LAARLSSWIAEYQDGNLQFYDLAYAQAFVAQADDDVSPPPGAVPIVSDAEPVTAFTARCNAGWGSAATGRARSA